MAHNILHGKHQNVLPSQTGLPDAEIVRDCMIKAKALSDVGYHHLINNGTLSAHYMSIIDELLEIGLNHS